MDGVAGREGAAGEEDADAPAYEDDAADLLADRGEVGVQQVGGGDDRDRPADVAGRGDDRLPERVTCQRSGPVVDHDHVDLARAHVGRQDLEGRPLGGVAGRAPVDDQHLAIAEVRRDGQTWFVVIRGHGPDAELIPVDAGVLPESTLAALLTYVSQQMASGEGVR